MGVASNDCAAAWRARCGAAMSWRPRGKMMLPTARMRRDMFASRDFPSLSKDFHDFHLPIVYVAP